MNNLPLRDSVSCNVYTAVAASSNTRVRDLTNVCTNDHVWLDIFSFVHSPVSAMKDFITNRTYACVDKKINERL
jgi:hypothetical protein